MSGPNGIVSRSTKGIDNARQLLARDELQDTFLELVEENDN